MSEKEDEIKELAKAHHQLNEIMTAMWDVECEDIETYGTIFDAQEAVERAFKAVSRRYKQLIG